MLFLININKLRKLLVENIKFIEWNPKGCRENVDKRITIERKNKPKLIENPDGSGEYKRISYIEIEIIE